MPNEVLTIQEISALLGLAEKTVYAMANAGALPAFEIRRQWFEQNEIVRWVGNWLAMAERLDDRFRQHKPVAATTHEDQDTELVSSKRSR